jgi:peptidoglycan/xylan/chitin deacetylase (PgdA/CDA1 family)
LLLAGSLHAQAQPAFRWPEGKRAAVSLSFDDARTSQVDAGIPFLNQHEAKATFYVVPRSMTQRLEGWKKAAAAGHEIAHHSNTHPCSANYAFSKANALEDYTLARMEADLDTATREIKAQVGIAPVSFAYPCGQKFVGRGADARSYVPQYARLLAYLSGSGGE